MPKVRQNVSRDRPLGKAHFEFPAFPRMPAPFSVPVNVVELDFFVFVYPCVVICAGVIAALYLYNRFLVSEVVKTTKSI